MRVAKAAETERDAAAAVAIASAQEASSAQAAEAAADLGLDSEALADLAGKRENLPRLLTGLVRAALDDAKDDILAAAA